jgi:hypothetical protein
MNCQRYTAWRIKKGTVEKVWSEFYSNPTPSPRIIIAARRLEPKTAWQLISRGQRKNITKMMPQTATEAYTLLLRTPASKALDGRRFPRARKGKIEGATLPRRRTDISWPVRLWVIEIWAGGFEEMHACWLDAAILWRVTTGEWFNIKMSITTQPLWGYWSDDAWTVMWSSKEEITRGYVAVRG